MNIWKLHKTSRFATFKLKSSFICKYFCDFRKSVIIKVTGGNTENLIKMIKPVNNFVRNGSKVMKQFFIYIANTNQQYNMALFSSIIAF